MKREETKAHIMANCGGSKMEPKLRIGDRGYQIINESKVVPGAGDVSIRSFFCFRWSGINPLVTFCCCVILPAHDHSARKSKIWRCIIELNGGRIWLLPRFVTLPEGHLYWEYSIRNISFGLKILRSLYCQATRSHPANKQTNNQATNQWQRPNNQNTTKQNQSQFNSQYPHQPLSQTPHHPTVLSTFSGANLMISIKRVCEDYAAECGPQFWSNFGETRLGGAKNLGSLPTRSTSIFLAKKKTMVLVWILNECFFFTNQV